ncbi:MAG: hypothetical protein AAGN66_13950 [Acidobacteriota bacterium]
MSRHLCMQCWRLIPRDELLYSSSDREESAGGGAQGPSWMLDPNEQKAELKPVGRRSRSRLAAWIGDAEESLDDVRRGIHPNARVTLHCPCGAVLPRRAEVPDGKPLGLGFAGPRASGKTLMLLAMVHELRRGGLLGGRLGLSGLGDTEERFGELLGDLFRDRRKPAPSPVEAPMAASSNHRSFCWQVMVDGRRGRSGSQLMGIYDLAGETWGAPADQALPRFESYLSLLGALVFVIDGAAVAADLGLPADDAWDRDRRRPADMGAADHQWLASLVDRLGPRARRDVRLALVVSKADLIWRDDDWRDDDRREAPPPAEGSDHDPLAHVDHDEILGLLERSGRRDLWVTARHHFRDVRLFAASSLGFRPGPDDVDGDHRLARAPRPRGVLEPLSWLLSAAIPELGRDR